MLKKMGLTASLATILATSTVMADLSSSDLQGARGTMRNIDSAINKAVLEAERLYEQNGGSKMNTVYVIKDNNSGNNADNPYLSRLRITGTYEIEIQLSGNSDYNNKHNSYVKTGKDGGMESPVAKGLLGTQILLLPVYNKKDEKITAWECVTNADRNIQAFMGDQAKEFAASVIREASDNVYLSLCTYINRANLFSGGDGGGGGGGGSGSGPS